MTNGSVVLGTAKTTAELQTEEMATTLGGAYIYQANEYPALILGLQGAGTATDPYIIGSDSDLAFAAMMSNSTDTYFRSIYHNAYYKQTEDVALRANDSITITSGMTYTVDAGKTITINGKVIDNAGGHFVGTDAGSQLVIATGAVYGTKAEGTYVWFDGEWTIANSWIHIGAMQPALTFDANGVCEIGTAQQLARLSYEANFELLPALPTNLDHYTFKLTNDINLAGHEWCAIASRYFTSDYFEDVFDGQGHTIKNLTITNDNQHLNTWDNALFGHTFEAELKNFKMEDVNIHADRVTEIYNVAGVAGWAISTSFKDIEIVSGTIYDQGGSAAGVVGTLNVYGSPSVLSNVVNRATITGTPLQSVYFILGGIVAHQSNSYGSTYNGDQIIFEKCANYGDIISPDPYQMLADGVFSDANYFYGYTIAGQIVGQSDYSAQNYVVFDSCVAGGNVYGGPALKYVAGELLAQNNVSTNPGVFQGHKWTGLGTTEPYGYAITDYYFGQEKVFFTDKNAEAISQAIENDEFTTANHEHFTTGDRPTDNAGIKAVIATKALISNSTGGQSFIFRAPAVADNVLYTTVDSAAKHGLPGTIALTCDYTCGANTQWGGNDTIQTNRNMNIVVPANGTLVINGKLELGTNSKCVGTDATSHLVVTGICTNTAIIPATGIYVWDAENNKWKLIEQ